MIFIILAIDFYGHNMELIKKIDKPKTIALGMKHSLK